MYRGDSDFQPKGGVEEQISAPEGYRRFTVSDRFGVLIKEVTIKIDAVHPGFISRLHQFLAEEDPMGPRIV